MWSRTSPRGSAAAPRVERLAALGRREHRAAAPRRRALTGNRPRAQEAVTAGEDIEQRDHAGNVGPVRGQHQTDQAEPPQQHDGEDRKPGEDHPEQERAALGWVGSRPRDRSNRHRTHAALLLACRDWPAAIPPRLDQSRRARSKEPCPIRLGKFARAAILPIPRNWQGAAALLG